MGYEPIKSTQDRKHIHFKLEGYFELIHESWRISQAITAGKFLITSLPYYSAGNCCPPRSGLSIWKLSTINDESDDAYEKVVDEYLNSPTFGERWARHWMDIVRYAETRGHEFDYEILGAWQYRDYLIRAFNDDIPYDQVVREHLAGDLLSNRRYNPETGIDEARIGTSFFALSEGTHSPVDIRKDEADRIDNIITNIQI